MFQDISLIKTAEGDIVFVTWVSAVAMDARRVSLDKSGKIIAIVAYLVPVEDFTGAQVLVHTVGFPMMKRPPGARVPMPAWCRLAQWFHAVQGFSGPYVKGGLFEGKGKDACVVCSACAQLGIDQASSLTNDDMEVCSECLTPWHRECASPATLDGRPVPWGDSWTCMVCEGWL